jgi:hypothetical protein
MSTSTVTAKFQRTVSAPVLMLAFELGEEGWLLGFSTGFGQRVRRRRIGSRDTKALLEQMEWARRELEVANGRVVSCYEAGRDGFWLQRFLEAHGIESLAGGQALGADADALRWRQPRAGAGDREGWQPLGSGRRRRAGGAWLRFQPDSALSKWYQQRFGHGTKRLRKIGIVALARKLLIALWHWVEHGILPEGAVLKTNLRLV